MAAAPTTARIGSSGVTDHPIDTARLLAEVDDPAAGAVATFAGIVRNHDHGRAVTSIDYLGHPTASDVMAQVVAEFAGRQGVHAISAEHRVGSLVVGDVALYVAVAASHRGQAFAAVSELVDEVKARLPIWKKQYLADGSHEWSECP
ncbi:molybdenum cofactor biosynthesis protein MoaE [Aestuariimicrobium kwangyangense]|uniref:molybdenum cofactor biosynthesis protein MoaE n=1 Tax=Aestuariimicrobium kwangyangense TaxID=396389 RepID=UPI0003B35290|nr:molybdenum cofactor biosynthesis protein MoaE [Aestuariimicrobium kwangyangense]